MKCYIKKKIVSRRYDFDSYTFSFNRCHGKYGRFKCMFLVEDKQFGHKSCSLGDSFVYLTVCKDHNFNYYATKRLLIITKRNRAILKRGITLIVIEDCRDCFAIKNVLVSFFLRHCYLNCADICYRYGKYKRYYAEEKDNRKC